MVRIIISLGGTMTDSYPFTVFDGEFKGKRVLVTGGTKGIPDHPTRTQRESNKGRRIDKMLATITNPFGPSA
jgi:purine-nucleoside phosphorylase